jgi:protein-S-isoprenylcysteine O-methyltransferase Ste14
MSLSETITLVSIFVFAWQLVGAGRTFRLPKGERPGFRHQLVPIPFILVLVLGIPRPLRVEFVVPGSIGLAGALVLFEWARRSIRGVYFSHVFSNDTPGLVWTGGPFAYVRNPFYASYLLSAASVLLMSPAIPPLVSFVLLIAFAGAAARHEERKFLNSSLRDEYRAYARRTGRFVPVVGRLREAA